MRLWLRHAGVQPARLPIPTIVWGTGRLHQSGRTTTSIWSKSRLSSATAPPQRIAVPTAGLTHSERDRPGAPCYLPRGRRAAPANTGLRPRSRACWIDRGLPAQGVPEVPPALAQPAAGLIGAALPGLPAIACQRADRLPEAALGLLARAFRSVLASSPGHVGLLHRCTRVLHQSPTRCRLDDRRFISIGQSPRISAIGRGIIRDSCGACRSSRPDFRSSQARPRAEDPLSERVFGVLVRLCGVRLRGGAVSVGVMWASAVVRGRSAVSV